MFAETYRYEDLLSTFFIRCSPISTSGCQSKKGNQTAPDAADLLLNLQAQKIISTQ